MHEALVHSSDEEWLARVVPYLRDGLAAGQPTIAVLTLANAARLREALGQDAERVSFTDASSRYRRPARAIAELRRQLDLQLTQPDAELVRFVGEVVFGPDAEENAGWIRYESVITALIGAVLGLILGMIFAALMSVPLADQGFGLTYPIGQLILLLVLAALAGVLAAIGPARRAARLDVLEALAYE